MGCGPAATAESVPTRMGIPRLSHAGPFMLCRSCMVSSLGVLVGYKAELELQKEAAAVAHRIQWRP